MSQIDFSSFSSLSIFQLISWLIFFPFVYYFCSMWLLCYVSLEVGSNDLPLPWQLSFQNSASPQMEGIVDLYADIMTFLVGIFLFVIYVIENTVYFWNIERNKLESMYLLQPRKWVYFNYHVLLETIWTITPAFILLIIAIPSFSLLFALEDDLDVSVWVKVIGAQWYWIYEYNGPSETEEDLSINSFMISTDDLEEGELRLLQVDNWLVLPINTGARFFVTSQDVLHSWAVPSLGIKIDACPGRINVVTVFLKRSGVFYGQCSEICGVNHAFMPIIIEVKNIK